MNPISHHLSPQLGTSFINGRILLGLKEGKYDELILLAKNGYDFSSLGDDVKGNFGDQFLQLCLRSYESSDYLTLAIGLCQAGINLGASCPRTGLTPLHIALQANQTRLFQAIHKEAVKQGIAESLFAKKERLNRTPLELWKSYEACVCLSLDEKIPHYTPELGVALLPLAIQYGASEELLLPYIDSGAFVDLSSALVSACQSRRESIACRLIEKGAQDAATAKGSSLQFAIVNRMWSVVEMLMPQAKAVTILAADERGENALIRAIQLSREDVALALVEKLDGVPYDVVKVFQVARSHQSFGLLEKLLPQIPDSILFGAGGACLDLLRMADHQQRSAFALKILERAQGGHKGEYLKRVHYEFIYELIKNSDDLKLLTLFLALITDPILNNRDIRLESNLRKAHMGLGCFMIACKEANLELARTLLRRDVFGSRTSADNYLVIDAIQSAAKLGWADIVAEIVQILPPDFITTCDAEGRSPLFLACKGGHEQVALILLNQGATDSFSERHGLSLTQAIQNDLESVAERLIQQIPREVLAKSKTNIDSALLVACRKKKEKMALALIQKLGDRIPACAREFELCLGNGLEAVAIELIRRPAPICLQLVQEGKTMLFLAVEKKRADLALMLLDRGVKDRPTSNGSALILALQKRMDGVVERLVQSVDASSLNAQDNYGESALYVAVSQCRQDLALRLLAKGAKDQATNSCYTALLFAIENNLTELLPRLEANLSSKTACSGYGGRNLAPHLMLLLNHGRDELALQLVKSLRLDGCDGLENVIASTLMKNSSSELSSYFLSHLSLASLLSVFKACVEQNDEETCLLLVERAIAAGLQEVTEALAIAIARGMERVALRIIDAFSKDAFSLSDRPLLQAVSCNKGIVTKLLAKGIKNGGPAAGNVLYLALPFQDPALIEQLVDCTPDKVVGSLCELLTICLEQGYSQLALKLIQRGAWIGTTFSGTALLVAIRQQFYDVVEVIWPKLTPDYINYTHTDGHTALSLALKNGKVELARKLRELGADPKKSNFGPVLYYALKQKLDIKFLGELDQKCYESAFKLAATDDVAIALTLLDKVANPLAAGKEMLGALLGGENSQELVSRLLKTGIDLPLQALSKHQISEPVRKVVVEHLKVKLKEFPPLLVDIETSFERLLQLLYVECPSVLCKHQRNNSLVPAVKVALQMRDRELLARFAPYTTIGEFFNLLRTDYLHEDSAPFRQLVLSLFKENPLSRKKGIIVARFPEPPKGVYLFQLSRQAKKHFTKTPGKQQSIATLLDNIQSNHQITATPRDPKKRRDFYNEVAAGFKHVIGQLEKENNPLKWKAFLEEVASAGTACGIRYEQVANEQFITNCLGMSSKTPEDKIYSALSHLRYTQLQACADVAGMQQDVHVVRELLQELAEELGIACHGVNKSIDDHYHMLPQQVEAKKAKLEEYKKKFLQAYTLESICDHFLLFPDYQQDCTSYLNEKPPGYWTNQEIDKVILEFQKLKIDGQRDDEIKGAIANMGFPYPADWPLEKIMNQMRYDAWAQGSTDAEGVDHSFLYEVKQLKGIDEVTVQSLRFVTILEIMYHVGVAESCLIAS